MQDVERINTLKDEGRDIDKRKVERLRIELVIYGVTIVASFVCFVACAVFWIA